MKSKQLFSAIGNIDDRFIDEHTDRSVRKTPYRRRFGRRSLLIAAIITVFIALSGIAAAVIMERIAVPDIHHPSNNPVSEQYRFHSTVGQKVDVSKRSKRNSILKAFNYTNAFMISAENNVIENIATRNGDMILAAEADGKGWQLNANQQITLTIDINLSGDYSDKIEGERMLIGYFHNRRFTDIHEGGKVMPGTEFSFSAPEAGEYFWYILNVSAGVQNLSTLKITVD
jgi:hypothetical protein